MRAAAFNFPLHHRFPPKLGQVALCLTSPPAKLNGTSLPPCVVEDRSARDQERPEICWPSKTPWMRTTAGFSRVPPVALTAQWAGPVAASGDVCPCWVDVGSVGAAG